MIDYPVQEEDNTENDPALMSDEEQLLADQNTPAPASFPTPNDLSPEPMTAPAAAAPDDRLYNAQLQGNQQRMYANLLRGFQQALQGSAAGSGFKADMGAADALEREAGRPEEQIKAQLASEAQSKKTAREESAFQEKLKKSKLDFQNDQANSDPTSPQSKIAQDRVIELKEKESGQPLSEEEKAGIRQNSGKALYPLVPQLQKDLVMHYQNEKADQDRKLKEQMLKEQIASRKDLAQMSADSKKAAADEKAAQKASETDNKDAMKLQDTLDKGWAARGGQAGVVQQKINSAEAAETLIEQGKLQQGGLDSRQIEELAQSTARLLGGNNTASARVEALVPHTLFGRAQTVKEFLSNEPQGQEMQAFVDRLAETVAREKDLANIQKRKFQVEALAAHKRLKQSNPGLFNEIIQAKGISPEMIDEKGQFKKSGSAKMVKMMDPKGNIREVPENQVEAAKAAGGTLAE